MSAFHNNLALHISEATLKAQRRLDPSEPVHPRHVAMALVGVCSVWAIALALV